MFISTTLSTVKSLGFAASVSLLALTGAASAEMAKVHMIEVEANLAAAEDSNAAMFFPEIATDVANAIQERVEASDDMDDFKIKVDIRKVALEGDMMLPDSKEFNQMEGVAVIESPNATPVSLSFPVRISAVSADATVPEGYIAIAPSELDFYNAMVYGFANTVIERLEGINTGG